MAGGIEVVGIVLALYPIVVDTWQAYKAAKSGTEVNQMIQRLKTEQIVFQEFVHHLVGSSIAESQRVLLIGSKPRERGQQGEEVGCWHDPGLQADLKARLGFEKMQNILTIVENIQALLGCMSKELPGAARTLTREHSSLSSLKYLRPSKYLPHATLKRNLDILRDYNHDLQRLLGFPSLPIRGGRRKRRAAALRFLRRDFTHAHDIYNALCKGYRCKCSKPHLANLKLPRLSSIELEVDEGVEYDATALELLFSIEEPADPASAESAISDGSESSGVPDEELPAVERENSLLEESAFWTSSTKDNPESLPQIRARRTSQLSIYESPGESCEAIEDFCHFVRTFGAAIDINSTVTEDELGILCSGHKRYRIHAPRLVGTPQDAVPIVSLHDFLSDPSARKRERMRLALELSFAILQHYTTGWIKTSWTWRDFSLTKTESQDPSESQLFVTTKFYSALRASDAVPTSSSPIWTAIGEPIITRLGFALIELAMGKPLSDLRDNDINNNSMDPDTLDYFTARRILESGVLMAEQGSDYEAVVRVCLNHEIYCQTTYKCLDSRKQTFFQDVEDCVIAPLHSMWIETWGKSVT